MSAADTMLRRNGLILARPGERFAYRPICEVEAVRGEYRGCSRYTFEAEGTNITDSCARLAHEILLRYPTGEAVWHVGAWSKDALDQAMVVVYESF